MSCRSHWSGAEAKSPPAGTELEALLRASLALTEQRCAEAKKAAPLASCPPPPAAIPNKPAEVLSPSQVLGYLDCSARWHYKYVRGLPSPSTGKQVRGRAVHALASYWFRSRMAGLTPDNGTLAEAYSEIWEHESVDAVFGPKESPAELFTSGAKLAALYVAEAGDKITPAATEMAVEGVIGGCKVRGRVDLLCQEASGKIIDLKTTSRTPSQVSAGNALQLATYARLTPSATGLVQLDSLVATKSPKLVSLSYQVSDADMRLCETIYPSTQDSMRRGIYLPNRGSFYCSRSNCPFVDECISEFGGEVS